MWKGDRRGAVRPQQGHSFPWMERVPRAAPSHVAPSAGSGCTAHLALVGARRAVGPGKRAHGLGALRRGELALQLPSVAHDVGVRLILLLALGVESQRNHCGQSRRGQAVGRGGIGAWVCAGHAGPQNAWPPACLPVLLPATQPCRPCRHVGRRSAAQRCSPTTRMMTAPATPHTMPMMAPVLRLPLLSVVSLAVVVAPVVLPVPLVPLVVPLVLPPVVLLAGAFEVGMGVGVVLGDGDGDGDGVGVGDGDGVGDGVGNGVGVGFGEVPVPRAAA